jgi:hypothetical protein
MKQPKQHGSVLVEYLMLCGASVAALAAVADALSQFYAAFAEQLRGMIQGG